MKYTASLFSVLALVGTLVLPLHQVSANEIKTTASSVTSEETAPEPQVIGKVSYLLGQADMILPDGSVTAITKQTKILEGSKVSVKDRSKLNLLMVDGAIEKLPANSTLAFVRYSYDPANPKATEIRKELIEGEVTSKTGIGGTEAKERYRLNSPLAAIAVLGTEYTVSVHEGETRVLVSDGVISMAKLGGSCQRSGFGACADGEQLAAHQRGFALVVRQNQPRPVLIPAATLPPPKSSVQTSSAKEQAAEEAANKQAIAEAAAKEKASKLAAEKKATEEAVAKEKASKLAAEKKALEEAAAKEKASQLAAEKKAAEEAAALKAKAAANEKANDIAEANNVDKQEESAATTSASVVTSEEKSSDKVTTATPAPVAEQSKASNEMVMTVDERDPLAEIKAEVNDVKIKEVAAVTATPVVVVPPQTSVVVVDVPAAVVTPEKVVVAVAPNTASNLESTQPSGLIASSTATSGTATAPLTTPSTSSNSMMLVSAGSAGSDTGLLSSDSTGVSFGGLLESATGSTTLTGGLITTPLGTPLGAATTLVESSSKTESTVTTDEGEVIAAVTPAPVVETPVTPAPSADLPPVRLGKYDPNTTVDGVTLGDQVSHLYEQVVAPSTVDERFIERHQDASASLPEQRDVAFALDSYEATVRNVAAGTQTAATITDATLTVSSVNNTVATGFTLNSPLYTGAVQATGTYSAIDGTFRDDGTNPQTTINGAVGVLGEQTGAAYVFTHQIDTALSADGGLNWMGTAIGD